MEHSDSPPTSDAQTGGKTGADDKPGTPVPNFVAKIGINLLKQELKKSKDKCEEASGIAKAANDPNSQAKFEQAAKEFGKAADALEKAEKIKGWLEFVKAVAGFHDAWKAVDKIDLTNASAEQRVEAGHAFDKLFASAGELGEQLPPGPWTTYFKFLGEFKRGFFGNIAGAGDPETRASQAQMWKEVEK